MFDLSRDEFKIEFRHFYGYKSDLTYDVANGRISIIVKSTNYSAQANLDINFNQTIKFFNDIVHLWTTLKSGKTKLEEPNGDKQHIEFMLESGKFQINGRLNDVEKKTFTLEFSEQVDQSYMHAFIKQLKAINESDYLR